MSFKSLLQGTFLLLIFVFVLGFIIYGSQLLLDQNKVSALSSVSDSVVSAEQFIAPKKVAPERNWQIQNLDVQASSAISVETNLLDSYNILFEKNSVNKLPIASLTKLMTAVIVFDKYDLSQVITVDKNANAMDAVQQDVKLGDSMPIENFLYIMLIESSNKSAYQLSEIMGEQQFVDLMNKKAKEIGLQDTFFAEPTGLSDKNYSTAEDLTKLTEYILKNYPKIIDIGRVEQFDVPNHGKITNTNQLLGELPDIVGGKTGFTLNAKGCLLLITNNLKSNDYIIYVVLGSDDRFLEMKNIINWTNTAYTWQ